MTDNRTTELLPCPFCGGEAAIVQTLDTTVRTWFVTCSNLKCSVLAFRTKRYYTEAEAIDAWNTRAELGSGTCEMREESEYVDCKVQTFTCSVCGWHGAIDDLFASDTQPNYCPNCGKAVTR